MRHSLYLVAFVFSLSVHAQSTKVISALEPNFAGNRFISVEHGEKTLNLTGENYFFTNEDDSPSPKKLNLYYISNSGKINQRKTFWLEGGEYRLTGKVNDESTWEVFPAHPFTLIATEIDTSEGNTKKELIMKHLDKLVGLDKLNEFKTEFTDEQLSELLEKVPSNLRESWYFDEMVTYLTLNQSARAKVGQQAPDFTLESQAGTSFSLNDQKGGYTLMEFSVTGCVYCLKALPELKKINEELGDQIQIVSIWKDAKKSTWLNSLSDLKKQITWTNLWDPNGLATSLFEVQIFPSFVLINPEGEVQAIWNGYKRENSLVRKLTREMGI
jgi:peroxiredoxin